MYIYRYGHNIYDSLHLGTKWTLNVSVPGIENNTIRLDKGCRHDLPFYLIR